MVQEGVHDEGGPDDVGARELLTIDELAAATGITVRTTRYYATLGLIPPPIKRGRVAYYGPGHRARLDLVRALQDHGFTLQAIEGFLRDVPAEATVEELNLQRVMLTSWTSAAPARIGRDELEAKAGRALSDADLDALIALGTVERDADEFIAAPHLSIGVELLDLDVPRKSFHLAEQAIQRHMAALADELTDILHAEVLDPVRQGATSPDDARRLEQAVARLRRLTLEAVVVGFQRAANNVIERSLGR